MYKIKYKPNMDFVYSLYDILRWNIYTFMKSNEQRTEKQIEMISFEDDNKDVCDINGFFVIDLNDDEY